MQRIFTYPVLANPIYGVNTFYSAGRSPNVGFCTCNYTVLAKPAWLWPYPTYLGSTASCASPSTKVKPTLVLACGVTVRPTCRPHSHAPCPCLLWCMRVGSQSGQRAGYTSHAPCPFKSLYIGLERGFQMNGHITKKTAPFFPTHTAPQKLCAPQTPHYACTLF